MFTPGVSHKPILFSFTSKAPAAPTASINSGSKVLARRVAQGQAVVLTPHCGWIRSPAGPSAVITLGMPYAGRLPIPQVLATPVLGWPPSRWIISSSDKWSMNSSRLIFPSATILNCGFSAGFLSPHKKYAGTPTTLGATPSVSWMASLSRPGSSTGSSIGSSSKVPSDSIRSGNLCGAPCFVNCIVTITSVTSYVYAVSTTSRTLVPT